MDEVIPLARKLDKFIQARPAFTHRNLLARRPKVSIAGFDERFKTPLGGPALRYTATAPDGRSIAAVSAKLDGAYTGAARGWIDIRAAPGRKRVELTVITDELLAGTVAVDVEVPRQPGRVRSKTSAPSDSTKPCLAGRQVPPDAASGPVGMA